MGTYENLIEKNATQCHAKFEIYAQQINDALDGITECMGISPLLFSLEKGFYLTEMGRFRQILMIMNNTVERQYSQLTIPFYNRSDEQ